MNATYRIAYEEKGGYVGSSRLDIHARDMWVVIKSLFETWPPVAIHARDVDTGTLYTFRKKR